MPILIPLNSVAIASWLRRDALDNIRDTKEFVINVPSADLVDEVMIDISQKIGLWILRSHVLSR